MRVAIFSLWYFIGVIFVDTDVYLCDVGLSLRYFIGGVLCLFILVVGLSYRLFYHIAQLD